MVVAQSRSLSQSPTAGQGCFMVTLSHPECPQRAVVAVLVAMLLALTQCWWQSRAERRHRTRHPQGTSDSMGTHDQVLGFLTQRDWWQRVARSPWWPWPGHCTQHGWGEGPDRAVTCGTRCCVVCAVPGSARPCGGTCHTVVAHAPCHTVPCATSCATPHCVPHPSHAVGHTMLSHTPHPMSHPMCPGKDIRHNLATRIPAHSHQDRHRDKGTQGHISVAHWPRSALYFLLPLYKNKEVPHGRGHCPSMYTKNINIHK